MENLEYRKINQQLANAAEKLMPKPGMPSSIDETIVNDAVERVAERVLYYCLDLNGLSAELSKRVIMLGDIRA